jgi:hypothetical protein
MRVHVSADFSILFVIQVAHGKTSQTMPFQLLAERIPSVRSDHILKINFNKCNFTKMYKRGPYAPSVSFEI